MYFKKECQVAGALQAVLGLAEGLLGRLLPLVVKHLYMLPLGQLHPLALRLLSVWWWRCPHSRGVKVGLGLSTQAQPLWSALAAASTERLDEFTPRELPVLAWALAKARLQTPESNALFDSIAKESIKKLSGFSPQGLANLAWSFATAGRAAPLLARRQDVQLGRARDLLRHLDPAIRLVLQRARR